MPGAEQTSAFGNNDSGDIVGSHTIGGVRYGFLYDGFLKFFTTLIAKQVDDDIWDTSAYDIND